MRRLSGRRHFGHRLPGGGPARRGAPRGRLPRRGQPGADAALRSLRRDRSRARGRGSAAAGLLMRTLYFDCFAGISGDMTLGALVGAGVDAFALKEHLSLLDLQGYEIDFERVERAGISATRAVVRVTEVVGELVTPTGAAIVATLCESFGRVPPMRLLATGYGAGTREYENFPNVLRVLVGESEPEGAGADEGVF